MKLLQRTCAALCLALLIAPSARPERAPADPPEEQAPASLIVTIKPGDSEVYDFDGITSSAVGDPTICDIVPMTTKRLLINAKGPGQTTIFVFDRSGKHILRVTVPAPVVDMEPIVVKIRQEMKQPEVTVRALNDTVLLEGSVPTQADSQRAEAIAAVYAKKVKNLLVIPVVKPAQSLAETYAALLTERLAGNGVNVRIIDEKTIALTGKYTPPIAQSVMRTNGSGGSGGSGSGGNGGGAVAQVTTVYQDPLDKQLASLPAELKIINMMQIVPRPARQVLVRAKVVDINRSALKNLGVNWGTLSIDGNKASFVNQPFLFGQAPGSFFTNPLTGGGALTQVFPYAAQLNALITENKARVLSEPSLMVLDGNQGSMLVGGEIPIPVPQTGSTGGSNVITIEYKPFGVRLEMIPTIVDDNTVQIAVTPEVSDLDFGNAVQYNGFVIPALTVRRATSMLQMGSGETLIIGGLYSNTTSRSQQRIPLLSKIPVIGEFFKNTVTRRAESELVILIEPVIVGPDTPGVRPPVNGRLEKLPDGATDAGVRSFKDDLKELERAGRPPKAQPKQDPPTAPAAPRTDNPQPERSKGFAWYD